MDSRQLFDSLTIEDIDSFVRGGREEDLYLDFKTVSDPGLKKRDDRKNFAIAVSGFANSDGGLVVWGVEARVDIEGVDCACGKSEISDISRFVSKLNEYGGSAVSPVVVGVEHKVLSIPGSDNKGFAATLVPASDSGPHMAKLGEDRYYRRSGSSFKCMEHFEVADMFGRRPKPLLRLAHHAERPRRLGNREKYLITLNIENRGRGSARDSLFRFALSPELPIWPLRIRRRWQSKSRFAPPGKRAGRMDTLRRKWRNFHSSGDGPADHGCRCGDLCRPVSAQSRPGL